MQAQQPLLRQQADALARTAAASQVTAETSRAQSDNFRRQTDAITKQASALIRSAQSTVIAANAELQSAQANMRTAEAGAKAAQQQFQAAELLASTRSPIAQLASVELLGWRNSPANGQITVRVRPHFKNVGGGTLLPDVATFSVIITDVVPPIPPSRSQNLFGGNSNPIPPGGDFYPVVAFTHVFSVAEIHAVNSYKKAILVWGQAAFHDTARKNYKLCYLASVQSPSADDAGGAVRLIDAAPYACPIESGPNS